MRDRRGISRQSLIAVGVVVVLAAGGTVAFLFLSPPGRSSTSTRSTSATSGTPADTVVVGTVGQIGSTLDPADALAPLAVNMIRNLGAGLVDYAPGSGRLVPALADAWTSSEGGAVWTFTLRRGLSFPDGSPFNATDVALSVNRTVDYDRGTFASKGYDHLVKGAIVLGPYVVQIELSHTSTVDFAADTSLFPVAPSVAGGQTIVNYTGIPSTENPNGLGAYSLKDWAKTGDQDRVVSLVPNPFYWNSTGNRKAENVTLMFFSDKASLLSSLLNGGLDIAYIDLAYGGLQSGDIQQFASNPAYRVWTGPGALGGSDYAVSVGGVSGVVLDSTGVFRYYLLSKA